MLFGVNTITQNWGEKSKLYFNEKDKNKPSPIHHFPRFPDFHGLFLIKYVKDFHKDFILAIFCVFKDISNHKMTNRQLGFIFVLVIHLSNFEILTFNIHNKI